MALIPESKVRNVTGIGDEEKQGMMDFLQKKAYCWCKNRPDKSFALRDLVGGKNSDWGGTPLQDLYIKHKDKKGKEHGKAMKGAAIDAGWLLKSVLKEDKRRFAMGKTGGGVNSYKWK